MDLLEFELLICFLPFFFSQQWLTAKVLFYKDLTQTLDDALSSRIFLRDKLKLPQYVIQTCCFKFKVSSWNSVKVGLFPQFWQISSRATEDIFTGWVVLLIPSRLFRFAFFCSIVLTVLIFAVNIWSCPTHWFFCWVKDGILDVTFMFKHTFDMGISSFTCLWESLPPKRPLLSALSDRGRQRTAINQSGFSWATPVQQLVSLISHSWAGSVLCAEPGGCLHLRVSAVSYPLTPWL